MCFSRDQIKIDGDYLVVFNRSDEAAIVVAVDASLISRLNIAKLCYIFQILWQVGFQVRIGFKPKKIQHKNTETE